MFINKLLRYTVFPIVFPVELGCFHFLSTQYSELIVFQRALFTLNVHYSWKT